MASSAFAPFRTRDFAIFWTGMLVSNLGTFMSSVALSFYIADTTGKASWLAIIGVATFLPNAFVGPLGSAMADRLDRRRVLIATNSVSIVLSTTLAIRVGAGDAGPLFIAVLTLGMGCANSAGFASVQTILPMVVPREHLVQAVGLSNAQFNLGRMVGPVLAAVAISIGGIELALWCNIASFGAAIVSVLVIAIPFRTPTTRPIFGSLADGVRFARTNPAMRRMLPFLGIAMLIGSPFSQFISQMATNVFGGGSTATSVLVTCQGIGAVASAFMLGPLVERWSLWRVMAVSLAVESIGLAAYGLSPAMWLSGVLLVVVGFGHGCSFATFASVAHSSASDDMRGRVIGTNSFIIGILIPLGSLVQGTIADIVGLRTVTVGCGALLFALLLLLLRRQGHLPAVVARRLPVRHSAPEKAVDEVRPSV